MQLMTAVESLDLYTSFFGQVGNHIKSLLDSSQLIAWCVMGKVVVDLILCLCVSYSYDPYKSRCSCKVTLQVLKAIECAETKPPREVVHAWNANTGGHLKL